MPPSTEAIPPELHAIVETYRQQFVERNHDYTPWFNDRLQDQHFYDQLTRCWLGSQFAAELCCRQPAMFQQLVDSDSLQTPYHDQQIADQLSAALIGIDRCEQLDSALRQNRNREMLRIIWRDLNRLSNLTGTTRDISLLAEASIEQALQFHHQQLSQRYGQPTANVNGEIQEQQLLVLGMGKLGAWELNLSSDIDLIFCYPHSGTTSGSNKTLDNSEFFTRVARKLIQSLDQLTVDGFVFRVDMRLRPYGQSGALVLSFDAIEEYYQDQGRDWERFAMVKARIVAGGSNPLAEQLMQLLRPFTYRRYSDFSAVESLRTMKKMIRQEVSRRSLADDVKLGPGGIREIEFIAQCFQLIRGGRDTQLQQRRVQRVLTLLADNHYLPEQVTTELLQAYDFLRNSEHAIQAYKDQQTQQLPSDETSQLILATMMGFTDWPSYYQCLSQHRGRVSEHFQAVITEPENEQEQAPIDQQWHSLWLNHLSEEQSSQLLQQAGYQNIDKILIRLQQLREDNTTLRMQTVGRERLDQFIPLLLQAASNTEEPTTTLLRIIPLVEAVLRRTAYLVLLVENQSALKQLVVLCAGSPFIANQLARQPVLLDELLDTRTLYQVPEKLALQNELQQRMLRLNWDDLEGHMEALRYFKMAHQLHVCAAEVTGRLNLIKVSDYLTIIAEVILEHVLNLAWHDLTNKHGRPPTTSGEPYEKDFIIVGYGKMGGIELGHNSDLDLVFIHNAASNSLTDGKRALDSTQFFARLGQKIIHILNTLTSSGMLYEVDMRLRPSGSSGLLVTSLQAFDNYQRQQAWPWEHQALVRARAVAGDQPLSKAFFKLRSELLCISRDKQRLKQEVVSMREKMRDHLLPKGLDQGENPIFHLKHGHGGIVDIEFMVQYAVLAWSHQHPALAVYTDNIRILQTLANQGLFCRTDAEALTQAYTAYRAQGHRLSLQQRPSEAPIEMFNKHQQAVIAIWQQLMV